MLLRRFTQLTAGGLLTAVLLLIVAGCATQQPQQATGPMKLVWPAPPQTARIEFVRSITSDKDIQQDTTFAQEVVNFLSGQKPPPNRIVEPMGLAISDDGQVLYVSDFVQAAVFVFDFGQKKFTKLGPIAWPVGLALDAQQNLYVVEQGKKAINVFDRQGNKLRVFTAPGLERPTGIAIDRQRGKVYVADTGRAKSKAHMVRVFSLDGKPIGSIGRGKGAGPGEFLFPTYLTLDQTGNLYVTDSLNARVQMFDSNGKYVRSFGERGDAYGMFATPKGVAVDSFGNLYVADAEWSNVQIFNRKGQILLFFGSRGPLPGMLKNPTAVAIDKNNHIFVGDFLNHRVEEYRLVNTKPGDSFIEPELRAEGGDNRESAQQMASGVKAAQSNN